MKSFPDLFAGVRLAPADPLAKLVLADALDEAGRPWVAWAFRWAAKTGRHPRATVWRGRARGGWLWTWTPPSVRKVGLYPQMLPDCVWAEMRPRRARDSYCVAAANPWTAFLHLADALRRVREATDQH